MEQLRSNGNRVTGTRQVLRALKNGSVSRIYIAEDSDTFLFQQLIRAAEEAQVIIIRVKSGKELGEAAGLPVAAAAAALLKA